MEKEEHTIQTWNKLASSYQDKFMNLDLYNDTYDVFCRSVQKQEAQILEIGCGPGNITRYLLSHRPDFKIEAIDAAITMIELARKNIPTATFEVMDCREINRLSSRYDGIVCGFVMPYLSKEDCLKLIKDSAALLHRNGILYFSVIEEDYNKSTFETSSNGEHTIFVYYHQKDYLSEALKENDFELLQVIRKKYQKAEEESIHLIMIAKKQ